MAKPQARVFDGMKFMWDGADYDSAEEAEKARKEYEKDGFETRTAEEEGKFRVYTRRVVTEVAVDGQPPL